MITNTMQEEKHRMSTIQTKSDANSGFERQEAAPSLSKFAREVENKEAVLVQERRMIGSGQESGTQNNPRDRLLVLSMKELVLYSTRQK